MPSPRIPGPLLRTAWLACAVIWAASCTGIQAQSWFAPRHKVHLPETLRDFTPLAAIDVDGDGIAEIYGRTDPQTAGVLAFESNERFVLRPMPQGLTQPLDNPLVGDVDGDGFDDLISDSVWLNDQQGGFIDQTPTHWLVSGVAQPTLLIDLDGDGDLDAIARSSNAALRYLENDGAGRFSPRPTAVGPAVVMGSGDLDVDGQIDLVDDMGRPWLRTGPFQFVDVSATHLALPPDYSDPMVIVDVTGDGAPEILTSRSGVHVLLLNDGTGQFSDATQTLWPEAPFGPIGSFTAADFDGDGDQDLVTCIFVPGSDLAGEESLGRDLLYLNDGSGQLIEDSAGRLEPDACQTLGSWALDFDGDGDQDLVTLHVDFVATCNLGLHRNDGSARFVELANPWELHLGGIEETISFGDLDGDQLPEAIAVSGNRAFFRSASCSGHFDDEPLETDVLGGPPSFPFGQILADLDLDGDLDLLPFTRDLRWHENTTTAIGAVEFGVDHAMPQAGSTPTSILPVDLDGDSDIDLIVRGQTSELYENLGGGVFTNRGQPAALASGDWCLIAARIDANAALGLIATPMFGSAPLQVLMHDGTFGFVDETATRAPQQLTLRSSRAVDLDLDGDDDLLLTDPNSQESVLWLNTNGVFTDETSSHLPTAAGTRTPIREVFDGNADGFPDLAILDPLGASFGKRVLWNDGTGTFTLGDTDTRFFGQPGTDFDLDGDIDLVVLERYRFGIEWNNARQISCPTVPRIGGSLDLQIDLRLPGASPGGLVVPVVGQPQPLPVATLIGPLFLDPLAVLTLPGQQITTAVGQVQAQAQIPLSTSLIGIQLAAQAFVGPNATPIPFVTGAVLERVQN